MLLRIALLLLSVKVTSSTRKTFPFAAETPLIWLTVVLLLMVKPCVDGAGGAGVEVEVPPPLLYLALYCSEPSKPS